MNKLIVEAINSKRRLSFTYHGKRRIGEPQSYGIGTKGTELLRVHQIEGGEQREPLFDVSKIKDLVAIDSIFRSQVPTIRKTTQR
jgi:hypothetical protein